MSPFISSCSTVTAFHWGLQRDYHYVWVQGYYFCYCHSRYYFYYCYYFYYYHVPSMLRFSSCCFFCWMFLPERVKAAPLPSTGTWSHMPAAGDRERQLNRSMNESNLQTWMQINLYLQQDLMPPEAVFTCWSILEIWGIACTLPAQKIATLIYLQPLGNMKGGKKIWMTHSFIFLLNLVELSFLSNIHSLIFVWELLLLPFFFFLIAFVSVT